MSLSTQRDFAQSLLDRTSPLPAGLRSWTGSPPGKRHGVYRNNVATGLARALAARFPITQKIVGEEFFIAMAREFALQHPPTSPVLLHYGAGLADFIASFAPAAELTYLADILRLEDAQVRAYHARNVAPVEPQALARLPADRLGSLSFVFHPAAAMLRSAFPVVTIWAMNTGEEPLRAITDWQGENALVTRPELAVLTRRISSVSALFLDGLMSGETLGTAFEAALGEDPGFDLGRNLAELLRAGAVIDIIADPPLEA